MISSAQKTQVKNIIKLNQKAKARREQGLFIAEGRKMFLEAPDDWIEKIYVAESMLEDEEVMTKVRRFSWEAVENGVFRQMCDTQTPQGILTVLRQPSYELEDLLKEEKPLLMVLEDLQDPGNAGTIIRTGEGAGVSGVFLTKTCVDITNPKVIRATMGSVYRIPFFFVEDVVSLKQKLQGRGIRFFAAHLQGKNSYDREYNDLHSSHQVFYRQERHHLIVSCILDRLLCDHTTNDHFLTVINLRNTSFIVRLEINRSR